MAKSTNINNRRYLGNKYKLLSFIKGIVDSESSLMDKSSEYDEIISRVHKLFEVDKINFDIDWREKFMKNIV